jgi:hypothetical protein
MELNARFSGIKASPPLRPKKMVARSGDEKVFIIAHLLF